jgi:uncharacterized membrane protein
MLFTQVVVGVIVVVGLILFIVPGIVFALRLQYATYVLIDKKLNIFDAVRESWNITKGSTMNLLGFAVVSFFVAMGGAMLLGVGLLLAIPTIMIATAYIYRKLSVKTS